MVENSAVPQLLAAARLGIPYASLVYNKLHLNFVLKRVDAEVTRQFGTPGSWCFQGDESVEVVKALFPELMKLREEEEDNSHADGAESSSESSSDS